MKENLGTIKNKLEYGVINSTEIFKDEDTSNIAKDKVKIVFFVKQGLDSFLGDIIDGLSQEYETRKFIVTEYQHIDEGIQWADICWFEWCDELIAYGSKLELAKEKKIICRLHSYEAFTNYINDVNWDNIDKVIFVGENIRKFVIDKYKIKESKTVLIPNGVNINKYTFKERKVGFNIAYVGYINYKKGPMLLLQTFKAIYDKDHRYKLYIAGQFQDERDVLYYQQMIVEFGLENNVFYEGWQDNLDKWLEDKNYIVCTSVLESQNISVMQAMCKGIKPIIHNFVGAKVIYPSKYVWNTLNEAVKMVSFDEYNSVEYRKFIEDNYSYNKQLLKIKNLIIELKDKKIYNTILTEEPLVTVGIINYNYSRFLDQSITSVLNQNYKNIEILIIDDCSVDGSIEKIKMYEKNYPNIRGIFHKENSGSAVRGIQKTISEAKGKYLMFLSADDYLVNHKAIYDFIIELVNETEIDYIYSNLKIVDKQGKHKDVWKYKHYSSEEIIQSTFKRGGSGILPVTAGIYKTDFYSKNNLNWYDDKDNVVAGDTLNSLIYIKNNFKYKHIDKELICYRHHDKNMTYDIKNRIKSIISVMDYIINNFSEKIYLSEVNWSELKDFGEKEARKMYLIGLHYMNVLNYYNNNEFKPWQGIEKNVKQEEIKSYIKPLVLKVKEYLQKSLNFSDEYSSEIKMINEEIQKNIIKVK